MNQNLIDAVGVAAGLCGAIAFTPQILKLLREKDASSISLKMYAVTTTGFVLWVTYGVLSKSWPLILANGTMLCMAATILILKLRYR